MAKSISPINRGLKLKAAIKQCEATLTDKTDSLQRNCASVQKDLSSLRREFDKVKDSGDPAKLKIPKLRKLVEKRDLLRLKVNALEAEVGEFRAQQTEKLDLLNEALHEQHERMHGLLAYAAATGGLSTDATLLFNTLGDLLEAKTEGDRASAQRAVGLILEHGKVFGKNDETGGADDRILTQFEAISDPAEQNRFYNEHRDEIHRGLEARKNNQS